MAVKPAQGSGIGEVLVPYPEYGGPMALQAGLRAAEPQYAEQITGDTGDYTGQPTQFGLDAVKTLGELISKATDPRLQAVQSTVVPGEPSSYEIDTISPRQSGIISDNLEADAAGASVAEQISSLASSLAEQKGTPRLGSFQAGADTVDATPSQKAPAETSSQAPEQAPAEDIIRTSVQDYLTITGKETTAKTTEDYIKEFSDATGIDVSGKPDNSTALMTLGLALMQNKAGKGFDVGKMLGAVGEAGEKAMPAFEKAKTEARALRAKAGEYALGRTKEDQAKAMQRENFYIIPKGDLGGPLGVVDAITKGKGEFARLNSFELNDLDTNKEFNDKFEIVKASDYTDLAKEALKTPEAKKLYTDKAKFVPLYSGAPKDLGFYVQLPDANAGQGTKPAFVDNAESVLGQIQQMEQSLARQEKRFTEIGSLLNQTDIDVVSQVGQSVVQGFRNLGIDVGGDTTPITQLKTLLTELKAENAAAILQESGKTLSDNDRKMVAEIVGNISYTEGDEKELVRKLGRLYGKIVEAGRRNVDEAYGRLSNSGVNINRKNIGNSESQLRKSESSDYDYEFVVSGDS
jgi:hypothetical protein